MWGMADPVTSVAQYRIKEGLVDEFLAVVDRHWMLLRDLELVTERRPDVYVGTERATGGPLVVEIFDWAGADAAERAHTHPAVSEVWESMGPFAEGRGDREAFEFANLTRVRGD